MRRTARIVRHVKEGETAEEALQRRLKESAQVDERVVDISTVSELEEQLKQAGNKLVVVEVEQEGTCDTGLAEEPEHYWRDVKVQQLDPCRNIKHTFQRTARQCPDCEFVSVQAVEGNPDSDALLDRLSVDTFPSLLFFRNGEKLWEHRGVLHLDNHLGQGVMYYGDQAGQGEKPSQYVTEIRSRQDFEQFVSCPDPSVLTVVDVSLTDCAGCMVIFPAVLALAKAMEGKVRFARMVGDDFPQG